MGSGNWSDYDYKKSAKGAKAFEYSDATLAKPADQWTVHELLNPKGLKVRESRDSAEHPESNAVMVGLDVTGSMAEVVVRVRDSMGRLMDMLLNGRYVKDPQLLFYAVGDATTDKLPFQISQFESDIRINDQITKVVLEGGGGGQMTESYELGFYVAARNTSIDCFEKRGRKGYLFTIGDEMPYNSVKKSEVRKIFDIQLEEGVPIKEIVKEAQAKYHTFHIIPKGSNHFGNDDVSKKWVDIMGEKARVLLLEDPALTSEVIALAIGMNEGAITFEEGLQLVADKSGQKAAGVVRKALTDLAEYLDKSPKTKKGAPPVIRL